MFNPVIGLEAANQCLSIAAAALHVSSSLLQHVQRIALNFLLKQLPRPQF
jgi:hypothetical protein